MKKFVIIYEDKVRQIAELLAKQLKCRNLVRLDKISDFDEIIEAVNIGFVFAQYKNSLSSTSLDNMKIALCNCETGCLEYLFSLCVGKKKPHYSLKLAERLCVKNGFGVSYSAFIPQDSPEETVSQIAKDVVKGEIKLPNCCFAPNLYARLKGIN